MLEKIVKIKEKAISEIGKSKNLEALENIEKNYLGKNGELNEILKGLKDLSDEDKKAIGPKANEVKNEIIGAIFTKKKQIELIEINKRIDTEWLDVTLPGKNNSKNIERGALHPHTVVQEQCESIFRKLGFTVWEGNHIASEFENFESVNVPETHPARDMQDTFYIEEGYVLRTQTSAMQNTILKTKDFPIRAIVPGRVFRAEKLDARHEATFMQLEGIMVDKNITIANLLDVLMMYLRELFGEEVKFRVRPGYFPFVEPGMELEIDCLVCRGKGCGLCKGMGWTEVMPCGMIHPKVLEHAGIDSNEYSGYAFGFGLSRLVQMKYGIEDVRRLFSCDKRYLRQIG